MKRALIVIFSLIFAIIYALPNLALMFGVVLAFYSKYISGIFCLIFAYNVAKFVQSIYEKNTKKIDDKYSYKISNDRIDFTFIGVKDDGRQLSRLKFMREKFFKDE